MWVKCFLGIKVLNKEESNTAFFACGGTTTHIDILNIAEMKIKLSGNENASEQNDFLRQLGKMGRPIASLQEKICSSENSIEQRKIKASLEIAKRRRDEFISNWIYSHKDNPFSSWLISMFLNSGNSIEETTNARKHFDLLTANAKNNNIEADLLQYKFSKVDVKYKYSVVNKVAPDLLVKYTAGNKITLKDFPGKYLLLDFWASWCGPCRKNNPELKKIYGKYQEKGLQVLGISIDTDIDSWKKAIIADGLIWPQASDLLIFNDAAFKYKIERVPTYILISPDGKILMESLADIQKLSNYLTVLFGHNEKARL